LGEETDLTRRAAMLDEGLEILAGLWSGEPFSFSGEHYQVRDQRFTPTPMQRPRPPVWVAGTWPRRRPLRRAARWDGYLPIKPEGDKTLWTPDEVRRMVAVLREAGAAEGFAVALGGYDAEDDRVGHVAAIAALAEAGATWWVESPLPWETTLAAVRARLRSGPPR